MVICLERGVGLHMAQLMLLPLTVSCFSKIQIGFTFLVPAHPGSLGQSAIKRMRVCVCVCACRLVVRRTKRCCMSRTDKLTDRRTRTVGQTLSHGNDLLETFRPSSSWGRRNYVYNLSVRLCVRAYARTCGTAMLLLKMHGSSKCGQRHAYS